MMMRMKLTILAILLFQLTTSVKGFTFGDIIKFDRKKIGDIASYNHYATYVGTDKQIPGKTDKQDIFHFSGEKKDKKNANCVFAEMSNVKEESTPEVQNYRDHNATKRTNEDMTTTIISLHNNCTNAYNIISANCEHLATYIRYGSASCRQKDAIAQCLATGVCNRTTSALFPPKNKRGLDRRGLGLLRANQGAPAA